MNYAEPAPMVEKAVASKAQETDPATVEQLIAEEPAVAAPPAAVEPAVTVDDPLLFAPSAVTKAKGSERHLLSVAELRGEHGADFESYAAVFRGAPSKNIISRCIPCYFGERDFVSYGEVKKYALIKGMSCFIYGQKTDPSPLYAIPLDEVYSILEDPNRPDPGSITVSPLPNTNKPRPEMVTVLLKYKHDRSQAYQFTFDTSIDRSLAKRFLEVVERSSNKADGVSAPVTASVFHADKVSKVAAKSQPLI